MVLILLFSTYFEVNKKIKINSIPNGSLGLSRLCSTAIMQVLSSGWCSGMSTAPNPPPLATEQQSSESRSPDVAVKLQVVDLLLAPSRMIISQGL